MKKFLIGGMIAFTVLVPYSLALADPPTDGPPGQGVCEHGNSGQTCVPDPQPDHGQECEEHGPNEGGVNEDHCLTTTATTTTVTTPTEPPPVVTTTSTVPPVTSTTTAPPTTTTAPGPTHTSPPTPPTHGGNSGDDSPKVQSNRPGKLAFTGVEDIVPIGAIALVLLSIGSWFMWVARKR